MMEQVRWGIIGVGDVTEVKSGPGFAKAERSSLVAVMRRDAEKAQDYARRHGVPRWYDDAARLIHDEEVNAVYIATPPHMHKPYTLMAAEAGKPVYVEKPMAPTHAECLAMIEACRGHGVPLFVAYYRRAMPRFLKVRELLEGGAIGPVHAVTMKQIRPRLEREGALDAPRAWRVKPEVSGGGLFVDQGSHTLDFMDFLFGPVEAACGHAGNQGGAYAAEDVVAGAFRFASGVFGSGLWCYSTDTDYERNHIHGRDGTLSFSTLGHEPLVLETAAGERQAFAMDPPPHVQQPLIQTVVDELTGRGACPSTGESGARTTRVVDEVLRSYREGG